MDFCQYLVWAIRGMNINEMIDFLKVAHDNSICHVSELAACRLVLIDLLPHSLFVFNPFSVGIDFCRQNLTSVDVRL